MSTMPAPGNSPGSWQPVAFTERVRTLDVIRGMALFGVLLVNLMGAFRVSLLGHITGAQDPAGWAGHVIDALIDALVEFKAFALFSILFGVGAAIQAERAAARGISVRPFLTRRFVLLFAFGLAHIVLIWNGDILALYAVCGLLTIPFVSLGNRALAMVGTAAIVLPYFVPLPIPWPSQEAMSRQAMEATRLYPQGGYLEILMFRCREAWLFILPLWLSSLPRTFGLMLLGIGAWRSGMLRYSERWRGTLRTLLVVFVVVGATATVLGLSPVRRMIPAALLGIGSSIPLAFAYGIAMLLLLTPARLPRAAGFAAVGQMALTNYLVQSIILTLVFYGYGLGLFGKVARIPAIGIAVALYAAQIAFSTWWLARFRFGPFEWLWRSLTYGRRQPFRRA